MDGESPARAMLAMAAAERSSKERRAKSRLRFQGIGRRALNRSSFRSIKPAKTGFEDKILTLYARGMTTRDIQAQVQDLYGVEVSPTFISNITEAVMDEVRKSAKSPTGSGLSHCLCRLPGGESP